MILVPDFAGRAVAVLGLGPRGLSAARALRAGDARVLVWDERERARTAAAAGGFEVVDLRERDWADVAALIAPPPEGDGRERARVIELAALTRTPVLSDIELFARTLAAEPEPTRGRLVAVAGARGKSTTAALIGHVLKAAGRDAQVGADAAAPPLALAPPHAGAIYVLELGASDIPLAPSLAPNISVLLNVEESADDRSDEPPPEARVLDLQTGADFAVVGVDDAFGRSVAAELRMREDAPAPVPVSAGRALGRGVHAVGGVLFDALDGRAREVLDLRRARALAGRGAWQDAAAAYAVCRLLGMEPASIAEQIVDFSGLPHRLETAAERGPVRFISDAMAANSGAVRHALATYENVYWIAGGRAPGGAFEPLAALMPRVSKAYFIGEAAETLAAELKGRVVAEIARDIETAVAHAAADAAKSKRPEPVVLFSPGCSVGEAYADGAARGDAFRALVRALPDAEAPGEAA